MPPATYGTGPDAHRRLYRRIHDRLGTQDAFTDVRYVPSRTRPRRVTADVTVTTYVGPRYPTTGARLEIEVSLRHDRNHYWIQWVEPVRDRSCGWHQDSTHEELGACHFQYDRPDGTTEREPASFLDAHPLAVVETRLHELPGRLRERVD
ncbi:hypothetical protein [Halovivax cerinus]|uniref:Polyketide cyclase / dehydrase and lipid transport n=1 Tax=Halovivax cerinus TaxID=1487865 RepID=A0ABD5NRG5_9EURY|nr:hypothetical protein [Halovivax cerinus]